MKQQADPLRPVLDALLRSPHEFGPDLPAEPMSALLASATAEGVAALVAERIEALPVAPPLREFWRTVRLHAVAEELSRQAVERRIIAALHEAGLRPLVLKGAALARWLYPQPHLRARGDLDLLFADHAEVLRAETALRASGFAWDGQLSNGPGVERVLVGTDIGRTRHVDAHWHLTSHPAFAKTWSFAELRDQAFPLSELDGALALSPLHALLHNAVHRVGDLLKGSADRLIALHDLHLLTARMTDDDWLRLVRMAVERRVAGPTWHALLASQRHLHSHVPAESLTALASAAASEPFRMVWAGRRWYFEWHALLSMPMLKRPTHLLRKLLPDPDYMMQRYALANRRRLLGAYVRRCADGLHFFWPGSRR